MYEYKDFICVSERLSDRFKYESVYCKHIDWMEQYFNNGFIELEPARRFYDWTYAVIGRSGFVIHDTDSITDAVWYLKLCQSNWKRKGNK